MQKYGCPKINFRTMTAMRSIFELLRSGSEILRSTEDREKLRELWTVAHQAARLSKRQTDINILERVSLLLSMGESASRVHVDFIFGSMCIFGGALKGVCVVFLRQVEFLLRDCESTLLRKVVNVVSVQVQPTRVSVSSRRKSSASRRSSIAAISITPENPVELDFDSLMDLDALCDELNRRTLVPSPNPRRSFVAKRSRSHSCSSSTSNVSVNQNPFEPLLPIMDDHAEFDFPFIVTPETPPFEPPKKLPLKGFDPKIAYTSVQWSRFMHEPPTLDFQNMTPLSYVLENPITDFSHFAKRHREPDSPTAHDHRRTCRRRQSAVRRPLPAPTPDPETVSVVGAVDGDFDPIDELRGFDFPDDNFGEEGFEEHNYGPRVSIGGSSDRSSRRMSIASELLHKRRDSFSSVGSAFDAFDDDHHRPILDEPTALKSLIRNELEERGKKSNTLLCLEDVCPRGHTTRPAAVKAFWSILILASQGEVRINRESKLTFSNENVFFSLRGESETSSTD